MASNNSISLLLYLHGYSFYAQRIMMVMQEKKLCYRSVDVDILSGENYTPSYLQINPRGEVPVLKDGDKIIPDSNRIADYVEDNFSDGCSVPLIPKDQGDEVKQRVTYFRELIDSIPANTVTIGCCYHPQLISNSKLPFIAPVRTLMRIGDGRNGEKLRSYAEKYPEYRDILISKAEKQDENHQIVSDLGNFTTLLDKVSSALDEVENQLSSLSGDDNKWLITSNFTLADVYLTVLLKRLSEVGLGERLWAGKTSPVRPLLARYFERVSQRPSYIMITPSLIYHVETLIGVKILAGACVALLAVIATTIYFTTRRGSNS